MTIYVDVRGTLMLGSPNYKQLNGNLAAALAEASDNDHIVVWSWLEDEAEKAAEALVSLYNMPCPVDFKKKDYVTITDEDIVVDDKPSEWKHYHNGATIWTPEQYIHGGK